MEMPKIRMPNLNADGLKTNDKFSMVGEYLLTLEKNLRFVLSNLEEDNFSDSMNSTLEDVKKAANTSGDTLYKAEFKGLVLQHVMKVGTVYGSANDTDPSEVFGGTWEQMEADPSLAEAGVTLWKRTS